MRFVDMNDLLDPRIKNFEDLQNHFDLVERLQKSFYLPSSLTDENYDADGILINESLPFTEISVELFEKAIEELNSETRKDTKDNKQKLSKFNLKYATRISRKACISPYCFILALIYIKRLKEINPAYIKNNSQCDLFLISLIVASKFLYEENTDEEIFNSEWSTISGIDIKTLNQMEIEFLFKLDWRANVTPRQFMTEWINVENLVIRNECKKRSFRFLTYNEIMRILENDEIYQKLIQNFLGCISKFILIASFAYSSIVLSLLLLSRTAMQQNSNLAMHNQAVVSNQTVYFDEHLTTDLNANRINNQQMNLDLNLNLSLNESNDNDNMNSDLNSKTLNINKLNNLDLNELNNRLNLIDLDKQIVLKDLTNDLIDKDDKCELDKFYELVNYFSDHYIYTNHENLSEYNLRKELTQPRIQKLFLDYKIY